MAHGDNGGAAGGGPGPKMITTNACTHCKKAEAEAGKECASPDSKTKAHKFISLEVVETDKHRPCKLCIKANLKPEKPSPVCPRHSPEKKTRTAVARPQKRTVAKPGKQAKADRLAAKLQKEEARAEVKKVIQLILEGGLQCGQSGFEESVDTVPSRTVNMTLDLSDLTATLSSNLDAVKREPPACHDIDALQSLDEYLEDTFFVKLKRYSSADKMAIAFEAPQVLEQIKTANESALKNLVLPRLAVDSGGRDPGHGAGRGDNIDTDPSLERAEKLSIVCAKVTCKLLAVLEILSPFEAYKHKSSVLEQLKPFWSRFQVVVPVNHGLVGLLHIIEFIHEEECNMLDENRVLTRPYIDKVRVVCQKVLTASGSHSQSSRLLREKAFAFLLRYGLQPKQPRGEDSAAQADFDAEHEMTLVASFDMIFDPETSAELRDDFLCQVRSGGRGRDARRVVAALSRYLEPYLEQLRANYREGAGSESVKIADSLCPALAEFVEWKVSDLCAPPSPLQMALLRMVLLTFLEWARHASRIAVDAGVDNTTATDRQQMIKTNLSAVVTLAAGTLAGSCVLRNIVLGSDLQSVLDINELEDLVQVSSVFDCIRQGMRQDACDRYRDACDRYRDACDRYRDACDRYRVASANCELALQELQRMQFRIPREREGDLELAELRAFLRYALRLGPLNASPNILTSHQLSLRLQRYDVGDNGKNEEERRKTLDDEISRGIPENEDLCPENNREGFVNLDTIVDDNDDADYAPDDDDDNGDDDDDDNGDDDDDDNGDDDDDDNGTDSDSERRASWKPAWRRFEQEMPQRQLEQELATVRELATKAIDSDTKEGDTEPRKLAKYQVEGVHWLLGQEHRMGGGILADDMGTGKTTMMLTYVAIQKHRDKDKGGWGRGKLPVLVIAPLTGVETWRGDSKYFSNKLSFLFFYGTHTPQLSWDEMRKYDVVVVNYHAVVKLPSTGDESWQAVIADEPQHQTGISNKGTNNWKAVNSLKKLIGFGLSGTPISNKPTELRAYFQALGIRTEYPDRVFFNSNAFGKLKFLKSIMLRRSKLALPELARTIPTKFYAMREITASEEQTRVMCDYICNCEGFEETYHAHVAGLAIVMPHLESILHSLLSGGSGTLRMPMQQLKFDTVRGKYLMVRPEEVNVGANVPAVADSDAKPVLSSSLPTKIVIFCQYVMFAREVGLILPIFEKLNLSKYNSNRDENDGAGGAGADGPGAGARYYIEISSDGEHAEKDWMVFNRNENVVVAYVGVKSGGTGINLMAGNVAIMLDHWWNPSAALQAWDRIWRRNNKHESIFCIDFSIKAPKGSDEITDILRKVQEKAEYKEIRYHNMAYRLLDAFSDHYNIIAQTYASSLD